jgi:uncharacterized membrane protein
MTARAGRILRGGIIALAFACPFLAHYALATGQGLHLVAAIVSAQLLAAAFILPRGRGDPLRWLVLAGGAVAFASAFLAAQPVLVATTGVTHACIHGSLLAWFASSLRPGREALVTSLARQVRGSLEPEVATYTRNVTRAWCVFFAAQLGGSALLLAFAPTAIWSWFDNILDLPLVGLMFLGEYAFRVRRFRHGKPATLAQTIKAFRLRAAGEA